MNPNIIGSDIAVLEWNFIWRGKRRGLNIAYLEIVKVISLEDPPVLQNSRVVECLNVGESLMLNSRTTLEDDAAPIITNIIGKISAVSEVYGTSTGLECFLAWVEDIEDPNSFVVFSCKQCNFLWLQSWLQQGETYVFQNVSPEILKSQRGNAFCFKATNKLSLELLNPERISVKSISSKDVLKMHDRSNASDFDRDGYRLDIHYPDFKGLTSVSGIVSEAKYSHFGRFTLNNEIKVYMHMSGNSNFEHVRTGTEVTLENVRFSAGLVVGGRMSRLLVKSWTHEESSADGFSNNAREIGLHSDDSKPFRILSELLESCDYASPRQLENLLNDVAVPLRQFCPDLITKINFKTYKDFFSTAIHQQIKAGFDFQELPDFGNSKLVSVPVLYMEPLKKLENFVFREHNKSIQFGSRSLTSQDRYFKFSTIKDLVTLDPGNDKFMLFERVQNYWECKIMASCGPEHDICVLGILKLDKQRACLSLVDSENFIECVVTDISDELSIHSCFESRSCRLQCRSSPYGSQLAACPYAHTAFVDCLIRVDKFFLVSEYFKRDPSLQTEGSSVDGCEKRYIVFSAADVVSFGSQMFLEVGISSFPSWPTQEDVLKFDKADFSSSDWTNFSLLPIQDNHFTYECFILYRLLESCTDFSCDGLTECLENQKSDVCSCCVSFVFVVKSKDGPIVRVKKPDSKDVDLSEVLKNYLKEIETFDSVTSDEGETSVGLRDPPDWKNLKSLIPPPNLVNPKDVKFFESKNIYQFGMTGYIAEFKNSVCEFCLKSKNMSRQDKRFQEHFGPMEFKDNSEEVLLVFSESCAGWYPTLRTGCVYKVEIKKPSSAAVGRQFEPCAKKLKNFIRKKLVQLYGWKYVIEISDNRGVTIKRSYSDWFGSTFQNPFCENDGLVDNIKSSYLKLSKFLMFTDEGRIKLGGDFETLVGVVIMKRFNSPKYSVDVQRHSSKPDFFSNVGSSLPDHRNVVITLQLLGSEEMVKVLIVNNKVYKYSLGVLTGCCICFRRVLRTDFSSTGKRSSILYSFLSVSTLEVLSFPSDPFSPLDGNSTTRFNFKNRRIHVAEAESHKEGDQTLTSQQIQMNVDNTANLFEYSECQESSDRCRETVTSNTSLPYQFLRELLYKNSMNSITSNVFIDKVSQVILYYACPRHPDAKKADRMESLCLSCQSDLTMFRATVRLEVCDSTNNSYITCCDELARKTLNLSEQSWKELGELVKSLPTKNIFWSSAQKTSSEEYGLSSGNDPLFQK